jgi:hypothetical protein
MIGGQPPLPHWGGVRLQANVQAGDPSRYASQDTLAPGEVPGRSVDGVTCPFDRDRGASLGGRVALAKLATNVSALHANDAHSGDPVWPMDVTVGDRERVGYGLDPPSKASPPTSVGAGSEQRACFDYARRATRATTAMSCRSPPPDRRSFRRATFCRRLRRGRPGDPCSARSSRPRAPGGVRR